MRNLFWSFFSHRSLFYGLFNQAGTNLEAMAVLLSAVVKASSDAEREPLFEQINALEQTGDDITHKVYLGLDKVFFTPFNRNDIHLLASAIDDVADNIHEAAGRMNLYHVRPANPAVSEIVGYIRLSCAELQKLIGGLGKRMDTQSMLASCRMVKDHERRTDQIYYHALADLFAQERDAITLIKHRDILSSLEASANKCKTVTDTIEIIILNSL
jgi:uncharacterized protein